MKAFVNKTGCISCGLCVSICPAVFSMDENRKAEALPAEVPQGSMKSVASAQKACPASVIELEY